MPLIGAGEPDRDHLGVELGDPFAALVGRVAARHRRRVVEVLGPEVARVDVVQVGIGRRGLKGESWPDSNIARQKMMTAHR